jgi:hypothetical protein
MLLPACALWGQGAVAQFTDSTHYHVLYSGTGIFNRTEASSSYLFTNSLRLSTKYKRLEGNAGANWLYGEQLKNLTNNDFTGSLDFNYYSSIPRLYYWGLGVFEKSFSLKVNNRTQAGLGLAYNLVDRRDSLFVNISNGLLYEYSDLQLADTTRELYSTLRNSLRLRTRIRLARTLTFEGTGFLQNSLQRRGDYIIRSTASLSLRLRKWLALTSALTYNKVARTERENLLLTFGLTVEDWF